MNRIIKFRAFDKSNNTMHYPQNLDYFKMFDDGSWGMFSTSDSLMVSENNGVLQAFTGLTDKSGVEIYEGDIVQFMKERLQVIWVNGAFKALRLDVPKDPRTPKFTGFSSWAKRTVVIGNIHDNPELLTTKN